MQIKCCPKKVRKRLVLHPRLIAFFYICIAIFLLFIGYKIAFNSTKNNFAGYILFAFVITFSFWYRKLFKENNKMFYLVSQSSIQFSENSFTLSNPLGEIVVPYSKITKVQAQGISLNSKKTTELLFHFFVNDTDLIETPNSLKKYLPTKIPFHEKAFLIIPNVFDQDLLSVIKDVPQLEQIFNKYNNRGLLRL